MTRLDLLPFSGNGSPMELHCPQCRSDRLDIPELPRGDDAVECKDCGKWFKFAEVENDVLFEARVLLSRSFPFLPFDPI